ncbi:hypothetical protein ACWDXH_14615 [Micromonospora chokoriensis]
MAKARLTGVATSGTWCAPTLLGALFVAVQLTVDSALGASAGCFFGRMADGRWSPRDHMGCLQDPKANRRPAAQDVHGGPGSF